MRHCTQGHKAAAGAASLLAALFAVVSLLAAVSPEASRSAREKLHRIATESLHPGEIVTLSEDELNSYLRYDLAGQMPEGVRRPSVALLADRCLVRARINLDDLPKPGEGLTNALWTLVLQGERDVAATCHSTSSNGQAALEVESIEIDGVQLPRPLVDWLVARVMASNFPDHEPGDPFPLPASLREVRLERDRAVVVAY